MKKENPSRKLDPAEQADIDAFLSTNNVPRVAARAGQALEGTTRNLPRRRWWNQKGMVGAGRAHQHFPKGDE